MGFQLNFKNQIKRSYNLTYNLDLILPTLVSTYSLLTFERVFNYAPNPQYLSNHIYVYIYVSIYINAFTPNIKSVLSENLGGILGGTQY